eukprot:g25944.t1
METPAAWEALQDCVEELSFELGEPAEFRADGLDAAFTAVDDLFSKADDLVGPSLNPQLLPAGGVPMKQENPLTPVIEPLTRLYMRYRTAMFPRCKDCLIRVRFGRLWRTCKIRRHKARQPGMTKFKRIMNRYKGWKQSSPR